MGAGVSFHDPSQLEYPIDPKNPYLRGQIYILKSDLDPRVYVGKTIRPLEARLSDHRYNAKDPERTSLVYQTMREVGIYSYTMKPLEYCPALLIRN